MKNLLTTLTCAILVIACSTTGRSGWKHYGGAQELPDSDTVSAAEVLAKPHAYDGKTLAIVGTPREVCLKKGCWMLFSEDGREMRVTFKDYAFFVPTDTAGKVVRCEGIFAIADIPPAEAMHYLEDAGRYDDAAQIRGPVKGYTLVATRVEVREK